MEWILFDGGDDVFSGGRDEFSGTDELGFHDGACFDVVFWVVGYIEEGMVDSDFDVIFLVAIVGEAT